VHTLPILERLYRLPPRKLRRPRSWRRFLRRALGKIQQHTLGLTLLSLGVALWILSHVYYYNLLVGLESNVSTARAQIEVAQQRRTHIQASLTHLLRYYAKYERDVLKEITVVRKGEKTEQKIPIQDALARLDAVAEQYPNLQLSNTVRELSDATVASEVSIAERANAYNEAVNSYSSVLHQFPGNIFGPVMGFREKDYFVPEDPSVLVYREVRP
jgi:LemA protein